MKDELVIQEFYKRWREVIKKHNPNVDEPTIDLMSYQTMIEMSYFQPSEYYNMFKSLPKFARDNILKVLKMTSAEFKKHINKSMAIYRQDRRRADEEIADESLDI